MGLVEEGDRVRVDVSARRLDVLVDEEVLRDRASRWSPHPARYETGALAKYARLVGSAQSGAVTN
jgi:dihydroxy-acid dehydratase